MEIKTIRYAFGWGEAFDKAVNEAMREGWMLTRRELVALPVPDQNGHAAHYYAELVKHDEVPEPVELTAEPITWQEAARVLKETCVNAPECGPGCPMYDWCQQHITQVAPSEWKGLEGLEE